MNNLDNFKSLLLSFITFVFRRFIDVLDLENRPDPLKFWPDPVPGRALWLTEDLCHKKYKNKKEGFRNYLKYPLNRIFKNLPSFELRYRAPDPVFDQTRILTPVFMLLSCFTYRVFRYWIDNQILFLFIQIYNG